MALPDNEFKDLTVAELRALAAQLKIDLDGKTKKSDIIKEITDEGVTWENYVALRDVPDVEDFNDVDNLAPAAEPEQPVLPFEVEWPEYSEADDEEIAQAPVEPEVVVVPVPVPVKEEEPEWTVIKMDRENRMFQAFGYTFTREHPYVLVRAEEADVLIEEIGGFRQASPRELKEYYPN